MTSEEHQSILKAAVSYAIEETKRVCFAEMDQAMAELTEAHVASARDAIQRARAEQAAELAKFKALAETLAGALELADCALSGANMNMRVVYRKVAEALREYKEARDAS